MELVKELMQGALLEIVKYAVALLVPLLGVLVGKLLFHFISKIDNDIFRGLAVQAVLFAEDKLGPDTETGKEKMEIAIEFLIAKAKVDRKQAEVLVRSAYQSIFAPFGEKATS